MIKTIEDLINANKGYFSEANKIFFNDIDYRLLTSKTKQKYLVTQTFKFSNMFGEPKEIFFIVKPISNRGEIGVSIHEDFKSLSQVKNYLKEV